MLLIGHSQLKCTFFNEKVAHIFYNKRLDIHYICRDYSGNEFMTHLIIIVILNKRSDVIYYLPIHEMSSLVVWSVSKASKSPLTTLMPTFIWLDY